MRGLRAVLLALAVVAVASVDDTMEMESQLADLKKKREGESVCSIFGSL